MVRATVITGASKDIGRATADALVEGGWSVIGVARSSPANFPGVFIEADLADREKTRALADDLRRFAHPSDVAAAIAFLASNAPAFIAGQTLFVDGGASLGTR